MKRELLLLRTFFWPSAKSAKALLAVAAFFSSLSASGQINIAPQAVVTASTCNTGPCSVLNDQNYGTCGSQLMWISTSSPPDPTPGINWIEWNWTSAQTFDEMVIHHAQSTARSLTGALIQYWDGSQWVNHHTFSNLPQACVNSVTFPRVTASRFRITSFQMTGAGQTSNPNFREIEIFSAPTAPNDAGVSALLEPSAFCPGMEPVTVRVQNFGVNQIDSVMVNWELNGVFQSGFWLTQFLDTIGGTQPFTYDVTLDTVNFQANQSYTIKAWTSMPNNALDTINQNDTLVATVAAAIQGSFTVNSGLPTTGTNFASFSDLASFLSTNGVCGPVTVDVAPNSGPYQEQVIFEPILGGSSTNTITINGNGNAIEFTSSNTNERGTLMVTGAEYITFNDLTFDASGTGTHGVAAQLLGSTTNHITFKRCTFKSSTTSTSTFFSGVLVGGTATGPTTAAASPSHVTIDSCEIEGGYYGLVLNGMTTGASSLNNVVTNTVVKDFYLYGAYFRGQVDFLFENNEVTRRDRTGLSTFYGIYLAGENPGMRVSKNRVHGSNTQNTALTSANYPFYITTSSGTATDPIIISNNLVYDINSSGTKYGFYVLGASNHVRFYHNTMQLGNPLSTGTGAIRALFCSGTMQGFEFRNNILAMHDGSTGAKYMVYMTSSTSTVDFNNNAYFADPSTTSLNFGYWGSNRQGLADWQAVPGQSFDANSNEGDPIFIDPANGDLTPGSNVANNMGANLLSIVPDDYFGIARTTTPDAGAIEFTPLPCLPPFNVSGNVGTNRTIAMGWTSNPDADSVKIEWGPSGFQPGTGDSIFSTTGAYTISQYNNGNLQYNTCYDVYLTSYCGGNAGALRAGPFTYCMPCGVFATPYFEDFDGTDWRAGNGAADRGDIDGCWDRDPAGNSGGAFAWYVNSGATTSASTGPSSDVSGNGKYMYTEASYGTATDTAYLTTPFIDLSTLNQPTLSFWYHMYGQTTVHLVVDVWRDGVWDKNVFAIIGEQQTASSDPWLQAFVPLSNYVDDTIRIQFRGPKGTSFYTDMAIDEVSVDEFPNCLPPTSFGVDTLTSGTATLSWASFGDKFDIEWGLPGFVPGSGLGLDSVKGITTSPYTITGLVPGLTMHIYVRDTCDPSGWTGPLLITIPADHDAELIGLVEPSNTVCGDSAMAIEIEVKNNGLQPITNLPVTVVFHGDITGSFTSSYTSTIAPGATVSFVVGAYNTYSGGDVDIDVILNMANDQNPFNDSSLGNSVTIIPYEPQFYTPDLICAGQDSVTFKAKSLTGVVYAWFQNQNDSIPFQTGDSLKFPTGANNNTYYLRYLEGGKDSLTSTLTGNTTTGTGGNMFDLNVKNSVNITAFSVRNSTNTTSDVGIYYKVGTLQGHENNQASWTLVETVPNVVLSSTQLTKVNLTNPLFLPAGQVYGIYIQPISGSLRYSSGTPIGTVLSSNNDLDFIVGVTKSTLFGSTIASRTWNGIIHYGSNSCSDITVEVKADSATSGAAMAMATFNLQPAPSLDVDFDASASQNGHVYEWNFGDGNTIQTTNTAYTHTYAQGGNYTVTLTVIDTVCGTTDQTTLNLEGVSVGSYALVLGANVFPNPSTGIFTLTMDLPSSQNMTIRIVDMLGRQLWKRDYGNVASGNFTEDFNLNKAARGIYLLEVTTTNGKFTKRVVLE